MDSKNQALISAKQRVLTYLEEDEGIRDVGAFYRYADEETYILEAFVPKNEEWAFLKRIDPILTDIADHNDFVLLVLPLPPSAKTSV